MIRPGVAAPIRGIAPLAPTEPIDARALIFNAPEFGAQEVANLRHAMGGDGLSAVRQSFAELRDQADDPNPPQRTLIVAGIVAYLLGQHHLALKYLSNISGVGIADYYRGMVLLGQQDYAEAAEAFEEAGKQGYDPIQSKLSKAGAIRLSGKIEEAERLLRESAREAATRAEYSYQMGCIRADHGDIFGAIEYFERTVDMDPHHTAALFRLANEMNLLGNDDDAIRLYEQALSRPPFYIGALINLGLLYEDKERYPAAAFCFSRVLQFYPNHERAQLYLKDIQAAGNMYYDEDAVRAPARAGASDADPDWRLRAFGPQPQLPRTGRDRDAGRSDRHQRARSAVQQKLRRDVLAGNPRHPQNPRVVDRAVCFAVAARRADFRAGNRFPAGAGGARSAGGRSQPVGAGQKMPVAIGPGLHRRTRFQDGRRAAVGPQLRRDVA